MPAFPIPGLVASLTAVSPASDMGGALAGLTAVDTARAALDRAELDLVEQARHHGATWARIAAAWGLTSRQAAEQRWARLSVRVTQDSFVRPVEALQQSVDNDAPASLAALRAATANLYRGTLADARWNTRFARARLVQSTLSTAVGAPPGPLFSLIHNVFADLATVDEASLPKRLATLLGTLRRELRRATPGDKHGLSP